MVIQDDVPPKPKTPSRKFASQSGWGPEEIRRLQAHAAKFASNDKQPWKKMKEKLRKDLPGRSLIACKAYYNNVLKQGKADSLSPL